MGSLVVVNPDEGIEALLLLQKVKRGGLGRLLLERQMHALMAAVLLGMAWLDALQADAQSQPPDREPSEAEERIAGGERYAIVGAYRAGQPELSECALENGKRNVGLGGFYAFAADQVAAAVVGDRQRIAVLLVAQHELALVVSTPELIGLVCCNQWRSFGLVATALPALDEAMAVQHGMDGTDGRRWHHRELLDQLVTDLAGTPVGVFLLDAEDRALDLVGQAVGLSIRCSTAVVQPLKAAVLVPIVDLVASWSGDAELPTQRCHLLAL